MEGYNGWARPLDSQIQSHGYQLYNVNNLKLARFKEIFPAPAKSDSIDAHKILELFQLQDHLPLAKGVLQAVLPVPQVNQRLKRLTRRRRQLSNEKVALQNRIQPDLQAVCPSLLDMLGVFAEFETNLRKERQLEGIAKAKAEGKYKGRKPTAKSKAEQAHELSEQGMTRQAVADQLGIGVASVYRVLKK